MRQITVRDYMIHSPITLRPDMPVLDAVHELVSHRISGAPVIDEHGELVGMLTERDCLKLALSAGYYGTSAGPVSKFMSPDVETVEASMSILDLAQKFMDTPYRRYPVIEDNELVGIISRRDVLRALLKR